MSGRPLLVAHRAGNDPVRSREAADAGADLVEADVHMRRGRLELRHPRRLGPVLWDREGVALARGPSRALEPALAALAPGVEPMLDLKSGPPRLADAALAVARAVLGDRPVTISSRRWSLLETLRGAPGVRILHTAASPRELARLRGLAALGRLEGVCLRSDLITPATAAALGGRVIMSWPVVDAAHARRLAGLGVSGLICDDLGLVAALSGWSTGQL